MHLHEYCIALSVDKQIFATFTYMYMYIQGAGTWTTTYSKSPTLSKQHGIHPKHVGNSHHNDEQT